MKRIGIILSLSVMMILLAAPVAYGAQFHITKSMPEDGQTGMSVDNMGVKVYFNEDVFGEENREVNQKACKLVDRKGKEVKSSVYFNPDDHKVIMILADSNAGIKGSTEYTLVIDESFTSDNGNRLGETEEITFETLNPQTSMTVSMAMMAVMVVAMIFFSSKEAKKAMEEQSGKNKKEKVNPYKEAKRTGKTVEEVVAKQEKAKEKEERDEARKAARAEKRKRQKEENKVEIASGNIRVSAPRPISAAGSTYKTGRAEEARKAKEKAAQAKKNKNAAPKKSQNPNKNKGKRKKGK